VLVGVDDEDDGPAGQGDHVTEDPGRVVAGVEQRDRGCLVGDHPEASGRGDDRAPEGRRGADGAGQSHPEDEGALGIEAGDPVAEERRLAEAARPGHHDHLGSTTLESVEQPGSAQDRVTPLSRHPCEYASTSPLARDPS
jgi:hypothetical protein